MQSYKIYINEKPLILAPTKNLSELLDTPYNFLVSEYNGSTKSLFQYIDSLEKKSPYDGIVVHAKDYRALKRDFKSIVQVLHAAGGIVRNQFGEYLFIFRRGHWDIAKGKVDLGETNQEAAVREVMEETGIRNIKLKNKLIKTRHMYKGSGKKRIVKVTSWYKMRAKKQKLIPQHSEGIEKAIWLTPHRFLLECKPVYRAIEDVVRILVKQKVI